MMNRLICLVLGTLICCGFAPLARAGEADGFYKPTELSGYVKLGGKRFKLPLADLRAALLKNGMVVVQDNRIPVQKVKWAEMMERFHFKNLHGPASTTSPSSVVLQPRGDHFVGHTRKPLVITQKGKVKFITVKARMNTNLETRIEGDMLTMEAPVRISSLGITAKGRIEMKAKRVPPPDISGMAGFSGAP